MGPLQNVQINRRPSTDYWLDGKKDNRSIISGMEHAPEDCGTFHASPSEPSMATLALPYGKIVRTGLLRSRALNWGPLSYPETKEV